MPVYTSEALILRTYKLGEADRIVVFLTRDRGKKRGVAKGARRAETRVARGLGALTARRGAYLERGRARLLPVQHHRAPPSPPAIRPPPPGNPARPPHAAALTA